ncbi:DUF2798 domain-containing protein [Marinomonas epiphytica]
MTRLIFTVLFSGSMSALVSAWVTYINLGMPEDFMHRWGIAFINAWPASFTAAYLLSPPMMAISKHLTKKFIPQKEKSNA